MGWAGMTEIQANIYRIISIYPYHLVLARFNRDVTIVEASGYKFILEITILGYYIAKTDPTLPFTLR